MSSAEDEDEDRRERAKARVHEAFERWEKAREASYDVEALAEAALSDPHAFIVRMYAEAVDDAIVSAASPGPGLISVLTGEQAPLSPEARSIRANPRGGHPAYAQCSGRSRPAGSATAEFASSGCIMPRQEAYGFRASRRLYGRSCRLSQNVLIISSHP